MGLDICYFLSQDQNLPEEIVEKNIRKLKVEKKNFRIFKTKSELET